MNEETFCENCGFRFPHHAYSCPAMGNERAPVCQHQDCSAEQDEPSQPSDRHHSAERRLAEVEEGIRQYKEKYEEEVKWLAERNFTTTYARGIVMGLTFASEIAELKRPPAAVATSEARGGRRNDQTEAPAKNGN